MTNLPYPALGISASIAHAVLSIALSVWTLQEVEDFDIDARMTARPSKKVRNAEGVDGRTRILDASVALFAAHGFEGVSTTRIADAAEISQSVVLYHFGSKEALWREAMLHLFARVGTVGVGSASDTRDLDPLLRLKVALRRFVRVSARHPELGRIIMREGAEGGDRLDWLVANALAVNYAVYTRLIVDAQAAGMVQPHPPFQLTILLHAAASMLFNLQPLVEAVEGRPLLVDRLDALTDMIVETVFDGIARSPDYSKAALEAEA